MCRWAAYIGDDVFLEDIVASPVHSLIAQSYNALEAKTPTNGDGFGIAWYGDRSEPGLYRDILPAWSDSNLKSLCRQVRSRLFLAHVRASTGGETSRLNCHPFVVGRWSFMHNGKIGNFDRLRRKLESLISDDLYDRREGTTDSELIFLLMLQEGLDNDPYEAALRSATRIIAVSSESGLRPHLRLTTAFSDGESLYGIRYSTDSHAPTLYTAELSHLAGRSLVSEPFERIGCNWQPIAADSFVMLTRTELATRPFKPFA
jgi:predicted glutamine amidotransferase